MLSLRLKDRGFGSQNLKFGNSRVNIRLKELGFWCKKL